MYICVIQSLLNINIVTARYNECDRKPVQQNEVHAQENYSRYQQTPFFSKLGEKVPNGVL